jgi:predicted DNA-binding protein
VTVQKNFRIPWVLNNRLKKYAETNSTTETEFVINAIEEKLSRQKIEDHELFRILKQVDKLDVNHLNRNIQELLVDKVVITNLLNEMIANQKSTDELIKKLQFTQSTVVKSNPPTPKISKQTDAPKQNPQPNKKNLGNCPHCNSPIIPYKDTGYLSCAKFPACPYYVNN